MFFRALLVLCIVFNAIESSPKKHNRNTYVYLDQYKRPTILVRLIDLGNSHGKSMENEAVMMNDELHDSASELKQQYEEAEGSIESNDEIIKYLLGLLIPDRNMRRQTINNPQVLEEFKMKVKKKLNNIRGASDQRRNAVFRLDASSKEIKFSRDLPDSLEKDQAHSDNYKYHDDRKASDVSDDNKYNDNEKKYEDDYDNGKRKRKYDDGPNLKEYNRDEKPKRLRSVYNNDSKKRDKVRKKSKQTTRDDNWDRLTKNEEWNTVTKKESWDKKVKDDNHKPKKMQNIDERKIRPAKKSVYYDTNYKKPKNDRKRDVIETTFKPLVRTTPRQTERKKPIASKISSYKNPKPKKRGNYEGGFFGRTPIPYVGKRGIYVDK